MPGVSSSSIRFFFTGANAGQSNEELARVPLVRAALFEGHHIVDDHAIADVVVCIDFHRRFIPTLNAAKTKGAFIVLIKQEPPVVYPDHNANNPFELFDLVLTRGVNDGHRIFNTPQQWETNFSASINRLERAVAVSANKWSADPRELYGLRREVYSSDSRVDVFGGNWDKGLLWSRELIAKECFIQMRSNRAPSLRSALKLFKKPLNPKGIAPSKLATLTNYKASVVIENFGGYMSEKLIDSILCGTIPIYVGPDPRDYGIPKDLFVHSSPDVESVRAGITQALDQDHTRYLDLAREWSNTPGIKKNWEASQVCKDIIDFIRISYTQEI